MVIVASVEVHTWLMSSIGNGPWIKISADRRPFRSASSAVLYQSRWHSRSKSTKLASSAMLLLNCVNVAAALPSLAHHVSSASRISPSPIPRCTSGRAPRIAFRDSVRRSGTVGCQRPTGRGDAGQFSGYRVTQFRIGGRAAHRLEVMVSSRGRRAREQLLVLCVCEFLLLVGELDVIPAASHVSVGGDAVEVGDVPIGVVECAECLHHRFGVDLSGVAFVDDVED